VCRWDLCVARNPISRAQMRLRATSDIQGNCLSDRFSGHGRKHSVVRIRRVTYQDSIGESTPLRNRILYFRVAEGVRA